ncbi:type II toxin-antitoxin system prevent-host-death family antitoxin [Cutibacterium equinum]|uniref:Antitoxin n=1 Tax=Cutibacterium equinum TaxID=3016342 RepID=A0ABY7R176_9ACTN|nr:type II toxin-antitoxin system prevent-host-death family antitoxin [Cutibacterium equinum]WCC80373.1 type II toxin-antitoxin system prevent-host-death family antitoxin [Cutibacterium equinum]
MGKTVTSREFNRDVTAAKRAARQGPVTITEHGRPSHVLMTIEEFERLAGTQERMGDILWRNQDLSVEFEVPERRIEPPRELEL